MSLLHDHIVRELNANAKQRLTWLPEIPEELPNGRFDLSQASRKQLRLVANAAITALALEPGRMDFRNDLKKIYSINGLRPARAASNKLLQIAEWAVVDDGDAAADKFVAAARLAEIVIEHYSLWANPESFAEVAGLYGRVVWYATGEVQSSVLELLANLRKIDNASKKTNTSEAGTAEEEPFVSVTFKRIVTSRAEGEEWARKVQQAVGEGCGAWDDIAIDLPEK